MTRPPHAHTAAQQADWWLDQARLASPCARYRLTTEEMLVLAAHHRTTARIAAETHARNSAALAAGESP